ncbi:hypothetical protein AAUPMC_11267 [Pasteurella multocida subsp. multocida str. Anand1_cattle]|nr:hypothetical protein AAUPMC_11267 [Pasteurella multocida subsp. multocida str. Anand1_cattle]
MVKIEYTRGMCADFCWKMGTLSFFTVADDESDVLVISHMLKKTPPKMGGE